jgi:hypothetical protein
LHPIGQKIIKNRVVQETASLLAVEIAEVLDEKGIIQNEI